MDLPQEIADEVIDNLAFDFTALKSTSLVRKTSAHRSRHRLFYFVSINSPSQFEEMDSDHCSDPEGIASYPRVVHLFHDTQRSWVEPANLDRFYGRFRSFSGVERLVISGLETTKFGATSIPHYFRNFTATVRFLELQTAVGATAPFLCAFPPIDDLAIQFPTSSTVVRTTEKLWTSLPSRTSREIPRCWTCSTNQVPSYNRFALFPYLFTPFRFPLAK